MSRCRLRGSKERMRVLFLRRCMGKEDRVEEVG